MSFARYPEYKESGVEWPAQIPAHWQVLPLKHVATLKGRLGWQGLRADEYTDEGPLLVTSEHFESDRVAWHRCHRVSEERFAIAPEIQLRVHDLMMMKDGAAMGKLAYVDSLPEPACLNSHLLLFRPRAGRFLNRFLYYVLAGPGFETYMIQERRGSTFFGLSQESIGAFQFQMPPVVEQAAVVQFLDRETAKIDALVAEQQRLIELLKEKRQAVISHAVTKGLNPDAPMKDSGVEWLGKVPAHWRLVRVGRVGRVEQGHAFSHSIQGESEGDVPWFKVGDMNLPGNEVEMREASNYVSDRVADDARATKLPAGTVIFPRVGAALLTNKRRVLVCPSVLDDNIFGFVPRAVDPGFAYLALLLLDMAAICSPGLVPTITFSAIANHMIPCPPRQEQLEIVAATSHACRQIDELASKARCAIDLLAERRTALISAAVTGQIDVRPAAERPSA